MSFFLFILLISVLTANALLTAGAVVVRFTTSDITESARRGLTLLAGVGLFNLLVALTIYYVLSHGQLSY